MAGRIPQSFIDELLGRSDIVELIGSRVQLKKAGREYKACCPFHSEKTPSFWVSPDKQFYHCFGCSAHGTVLSFLMNHDRLSFPEAVEELASRAGLEVPHEGGSSAEPAPGAELYETLARVAAHWNAALPGDARARGYLERRGLVAATLQQFLIGYAPASWNDVLRRFGASEPERRALLGAGLIVEREGGTIRDGEKHYDRFRDRVMFPIRDARGRVIAFGGRIIDQGEPKYLNSPETPLFHKGRELYGLYEVRQSRAPLKRLLVVEGYMDVVQLHQSGITYAVATLGTATTGDHLKRIFRVVSEVVFAFDGDRAGRAAAWRALGNALPEAREGREVRFLFLPEGHDPDSLVAEEGREAFERRIGGALPLSEYLVQELAGQIDLQHADGRARFAEAARPLLAKVPEGIYRELLLTRLAETIRLPANRLDELWARQAQAARGAASGAAGAAGGAAGERSGASADAAVRGPWATRRDAPSGRRPAARGRGVGVGRGSVMRQAVQVLVHRPQVAQALPAAQLTMLTTLTQPGAELLRALVDELRERPCASTAALLERWRDRPDAAHLEKLAVAESLIKDEKAALSELLEAIDRLRDESGRQRLDELLAKDGDAGLSDREKLELQSLVNVKSASRTPLKKP